MKVSLVDFLSACYVFSCIFSKEDEEELRRLEEEEERMKQEKDEEMEQQ